MEQRISKADLLKVQIHSLITGEEFLNRVKEDPDSIWTDFDVRYAIEVLQKQCRSNDATTGRDLLEKAGLRAFVPRNRGVLSRYKNDPSRFCREVEIITKALQEVLPKRDRQDKDIREVITQALKDMNSKPPAILSSIKTLNSNRDIALYIIATRDHAAFRTLRDFYYKIYPELKSHPETEISTWDIPMKSIKRIQENPEFPFRASYNQAYLEYIYREHYKTLLKEELGKLGIGLEFQKKKHPQAQKI